MEDVRGYLQATGWVFKQEGAEFKVRICPFCNDTKIKNLTKVKKYAIIFIGIGVAVFLCQVEAASKVEEPNRLFRYQPESGLFFGEDMRKKPEAPVFINCEQCGKTIKRQVSVLKRNKHHFCSYRCKILARSIRTKKAKETICCICGKEYFRDRPSTKERFCSYKCSLIGRSGLNHFNWKGGVSSENHRIRDGVEIRLWREAVFARDHWTCQKCGTKGGNGKAVILRAHHIKPFAYYPELRTSISNGITFCDFCHKELHRSARNKNG